MNSIEQIFGTNTTSNVGAPKKELGQEDFLKLLVAQLKNQDPNNPADNGEFLGQIAQFSMVDGIDELGTSFDGMAGSLYSSQAMQASQLVGKEVLVETDLAVLNEGEPVEGLLEVNEDAQEVKINIYDTSGSLVKIIDVKDLETGMQKFSWDGMDSDDELMEDGEYTIAAEGLINGELQGIAVHLFSDVESVSVDRNNANILVHLDNEKSVGLSQIREYR